MSGCVRVRVYNLPKFYHGSTTMGSGVEKLNVVCHIRRRTGCLGRPFGLLCDHPRSVSAYLLAERVD